MLAIENQWGLPGSLVLVFTHATAQSTPGRPSRTLPITVPLYWLPTARSCRHLLSCANEAKLLIQGLRSPLWPMLFPVRPEGSALGVYASCVLFGLKYLLVTRERSGIMNKKMEPPPHTQHLVQVDGSSLIDGGLHPTSSL